MTLPRHSVRRAGVKPVRVSRAFYDVVKTLETRALIAEARVAEAEKRGRVAGLREAASQRKLHMTAEDLADWCDDSADALERSEVERE